MTEFYPHAFEAPVEIHEVGSGRYTYTVLWLPDALAQTLPLKDFPKLRIIGEANEREFAAALMPAKGRWYILFSREALRQMGVGVGDEVSVVFRIDDQDAVDIPAVLADALLVDQELARLWAAQSPGRQRGLAYRVASAKSRATQQKRIAEISEIMAGKRDQRGKVITSA